MEQVREQGADFLPDRLRTVRLREQQSGQLLRRLCRQQAGGAGRQGNGNILREIRRFRIGKRDFQILFTAKHGGLQQPDTAGLGCQGKMRRVFFRRRMRRFFLSGSQSVPAALQAVYQRGLSKAAAHRGKQPVPLFGFLLQLGRDVIQTALLLFLLGIRKGHPMDRLDLHDTGLFRFRDGNVIFGSDGHRPAAGSNRLLPYRITDLRAPERVGKKTDQREHFRKDCFQCALNPADLSQKSRRITVLAE